MAELAQPLDSFSIAEQQWRGRRAQEDELKKEFYDKLCNFPNLFTLKSELQDRELIERILRRQESELKEESLQYHLEKVRCHNIIIFCKLLLGHKQDALKYIEYLENLEINTHKSIIFMTLKAKLQYDFDRRQEWLATMKNLQEMYKLAEFEYLTAVAESEKGYLLMLIGPRGLLKAIDLFEKAIDMHPGTDVFLWKYDLALAIRRNFKVDAFSKHSKFSPSDLAKRAFTLLDDIVKHCPNEAYIGRAQIELARLVSNLKSFSAVCDQEEKKKITELQANYSEDDCFEAALETENGNEDFYILRECGRHFLYRGNFKRALECFEKSYRKRESDMVCQILGKTYLKMYLAKKNYSSPLMKEVLGIHQSHTDAGDPEMMCSPGGRELHGEKTSEDEPDVRNFKSEREQQLFEALDSTPFMDKDGNLLTTQPEGFGPVAPLPRSPDNIPVQHSQSDNEELRRKLLDEFDASILWEGDGECQTMQPQGAVGHHPVLPLSDPDRRFFTESSKSFPPSADKDSQRTVLSQRRPLAPQEMSVPDCGGNSDARNFVHSHQRTKPIPVNAVLKSKLGKLDYDAEDQRIKAAEYFYCKGCKINPKNGNLLFDTGTLYEGMRDLKKALEFYHRVIEQQYSFSRINLVNAYERSGLCFWKQSETCEEEVERLKLKARAEDMFMRSLVECRRAVAHLPQVSPNRATLWESYPRVLEILHQSEQDLGGLKKEAEVHEMVGKHLEAIEVYQEVMRLARTDTDRFQALLGTVKNYSDMGHVIEARFILDLFLTLEEEREWMLTATDDLTQHLRETAVKIYRQCGVDALKTKNIPEACSAFRTALLMRGKLPNEIGRGAAMSQTDLLQKFDLSLFYDEEGPEGLENMASDVAESARQFLGIRYVSVNNEEGILGCLDFESELQLAESAYLVMLLIDSTQQLSPRMRYLADTALRYHQADRVKLIDIGSRAELPTLLGGLCPFGAVEDLHGLKDGNASSVLSLFDFILGTE
ncbi:uncharacterized protein LOC143292731 [Babylonia areolata]|uniref:uncharacterized protein LOC143292731 n=1 Tax=Babylonia areolata TaxID=304850 RepID=UPI003FD12EDE